MVVVVFNDKRSKFIAYYEPQSRKLHWGAKTAIRPFNCLVNCYNSYGPNRQLTYIILHGWIFWNFYPQKNNYNEFVNRVSVLKC